MKARHPEIPWQKVAAIGNVLRHNYENIAAPVIWKLAQRHARTCHSQVTSTGPKFDPLVSMAGIAPVPFV